jgi:hypothetical protein
VAIHYLNLEEFAERRKLAPGTVRDYYADGRLPPPDSTHGPRKRPGWLPETVDNWERPGRGARTDLRHRHSE